MPNISYDFRGKVAIITGSSSGIGATTAILFAKSGAQVVITGRNETKLSEVAKTCQQISPNNSTPLQVLADVTKGEDLKNLVETTLKEFGKLDILVNNAGYLYPKLVTDPDYMNNFKIIFDTNLKSAVYLTHLCVEHLAKTKGNIINVSSVAGHVTLGNVSTYCMSKSAMDMFTKCMASELGPKGIRVNSVNPGVVNIDLRVKLGKERSTSVDIFGPCGLSYPVGRAGQSQEIGNAILFLASEEAAFITGTLMVIDGGHIASNARLGFDKIYKN